MNNELTQKVENSMTVADLISDLQQLDPEAYVLFACNYGDYHRTQQALPVESVEEHDTSRLESSGYSQSGIALVDSDGDEKQYYCEACDEEWTVPTCPKCKATCVNEDGTPADASDDDTMAVVILS